MDRGGMILASILIGSGVGLLIKAPQGLLAVGMICILLGVMGALAASISRYDVREESEY